MRARHRAPFACSTLSPTPNPHCLPAARQITFPLTHSARCSRRAGGGAGFSDREKSHAMESAPGIFVALLTMRARTARHRPAPEYSLVTWHAPAVVHARHLLLQKWWLCLLQWCWCGSTEPTQQGRALHPPQMPKGAVNSQISNRVILPLKTSEKTGINKTRCSNSAVYRPCKN
jgi:hypothetical protein